MPDPIRRNLTLAQLNASPPLNLVPPDAKVVGVPGTGDPLGPDPLGATLEGAKHVYQTYAGLLTIGAVNEAKALRKAIPESWIRAFHGSPYDFDKFDLSKIGTGEGAQAYGHGLYFAENPQTAQAYRDALSPRSIQDIPVQGGIFNYKEDSPQKLVGMLLSPHQDIDKAIQDANFMVRPYAGSSQSMAPELMKQKVDQAIQIMRDLKQSGATIKNAGKMYEVAIHASPEQLLDWDKPIHQQPQQLQDLLREGLKKQGYLRPDDNGPRQLKSALNVWKMEHGGMADTATSALLSGRGGLLGDTPEAMADRLKSAGIPGIRYLDQGSRSSGQGTYNYVIHDASIVDILKKYGLLLPVAKTLQQLNAPPEQGQ